MEAMELKPGADRGDRRAARQAGPPERRPSLLSSGRLGGGVGAPPKVVAPGGELFQLAKLTKHRLRVRPCAEGPPAVTVSVLQLETAERHRHSDLCEFVEHTALLQGKLFGLVVELSLVVCGEQHAARPNKGKLELTLPLDTAQMPLTATLSLRYKSPVQSKSAEDCLWYVGNHEIQLDVQHTDQCCCIA